MYFLSQYFNFFFELFFEHLSPIETLVTSAMNLLISPFGKDPGNIFNYINCNTDTIKTF